MTSPSMEAMNKKTEKSDQTCSWEDRIKERPASCHIKPSGDAGLTSRMIIIDTYGDWKAPGGGTFSGEDPTKVDRSAAYICRQMAKSVVASGLNARCRRVVVGLVQLSYAIGVAKPLPLFVDDVTNVFKVEFDCRPSAIAQSLALREPKYQETAAYCHFGRQPEIRRHQTLQGGESEVSAALKAATSSPNGYIFEELRNFIRAFRGTQSYNECLKLFADAFDNSMTSTLSTTCF